MSNEIEQQIIQNRQQAIKEAQERNQKQQAEAAEQVRTEKQLKRDTLKGERHRRLLQIARSDKMKKLFVAIHRQTPIALPSEKTSKMQLWGDLFPRKLFNWKISSEYSEQSYGTRPRDSVSITCRITDTDTAEVRLYYQSQDSDEVVYCVTNWSADSDSYLPDVELSSFEGLREFVIQQLSAGHAINYS